jgi:hypothetical protein
VNWQRPLANVEHRTVPAGLNFTDRMQAICADMAARVTELGHIDTRQVAFSFSQTRIRARHGLWASLTPMRFQGGALVENRYGRPYTFERLFDPSGREMLYILNFYLPRFLNLNFKQKLVTVVHELWHISPSFNGELRRHAGRCYLHTHSQKQYDAAMESLVDRWLAGSPAEELYAFLRLRFWQLQQRYGRVYGKKVRQPKLIPLD